MGFPLMSMWTGILQLDQSCGITEFGITSLEDYVSDIDMEY